MFHWRSEFSNALQAGKNIFIIMNDYNDDSGATGSTMKARNQRTYSTVSINNYQSLPFNIGLTNAKGRKIITANSTYKGIYEAVKDIISYKVIIDSDVTTKIFTTMDNATVGAVVKLSNNPGSVVLLPYFDFDGAEFSEQGGEGEEVWTELALKTSGALLGQIVAIDKIVKGLPGYSPPPNWVEDIQAPSVAIIIDQSIASLDSEILALQHQREEQIQSKGPL